MSLLPTTTAAQLKKLLNKDTGEIKIKYMNGHPRQYRFDASRGELNINGERQVTTGGKAFKLIPIAFRIFKDSLFDYSKREWLELFFINEKGAICGLMFHGYSVENFLKMSQDLFYDDLKITDIELTITPKLKEVKGGEAKGKKYYIAEWSYTEAKKEYTEKAKLATQGLEIYRKGTIKCTNEMIVWESYPDKLVNEEVAQLEASKEK